MKALLTSIHKFFIKNEDLILWLFRLGYLITFLIPVMGAYVYANSPFAYTTWADLGADIGVVSFGLYCVTLVPGILKRLKIMPLLQVILMLFRRQFGVSMFMTGTVHMLLVFTIPKLVDHGFTLDLMFSRFIYGYAALWILFPLWMTSNNPAQEGLGKYWTWVHRLTYIALLFIFLHILALSDKLYLKVIGGTFIGLEVLSWLTFWVREMTQKDEKLAPASVDKTTTPADTAQNQTQGEPELPA